MKTESQPLPLLRAPPFPDRKISVSWPDYNNRARKKVSAAKLFEKVRAARVGGRFWATPVELTRAAGIVVRLRNAADLTTLQGELDAPQLNATLWVDSDAGTLGNALERFVESSGGQWCGDADPWSALDGAEQLIAHGNDEWVPIARVAGLKVQLLSAGVFGKPGDPDEELDARALEAIGAPSYVDPFTGQASTATATIDLLADWRRTIDANRSIVVAGGIAWWKRKEIRSFLWSPDRTLQIVSQPAKAMKIAGARKGRAAIWSSKISPDLEDGSAPLVRVEDGFIRSLGLGSNLVPPLSIVVDRSGIHFDPSRPSDLEAFLATTNFTPELLKRAKALREVIVAARISKYGAGEALPVPARQRARRLVLVPGQVEDDRSVVCGGGGLRSNLELLRRVRALEPDSEIWFRPHPDVDAGHRRGAILDADVLNLADHIVRGPPMASLLDAVDGVHVLTSLTGFEALLRGRDVTCHGTPFYAGWGLTRDLGTVPDRRNRRLRLDELVAGVLILYPRYLDPVTGIPCAPEVLIQRMAQFNAPNRQGWVEPIRRWQGQFMASLRRTRT